MTDGELFDHLFDKKCRREYPQEGFAEMAQDGPAIRWDPVTRESTECMLPAGSTVKIVMVSRMGDLGVTDDLEALHGYIARYTPGSGYLTNCRLER